MSKTLSQLKQASQQRAESVKPAESVTPLPVSLRGRSPKQSDSKNAGDCHQNSRSGKASKTGLIFGLSAGLIIFILLILNLRVLYITRNYFANHKYMVDKLNTIEYLISDENKRMNKISEELKNINLSIELVNLKIKGVQEQIDKLLIDAETHALAIENLSKAKDALFKKLSSLENEIVILKTK